MFVQYPATPGQTAGIAAGQNLDVGCKTEKERMMGKAFDRTVISIHSMQMSPAFRPAIKDQNKSSPARVHLLKPARHPYLDLGYNAASAHEQSMFRILST